VDHTAELGGAEVALLRLLAALDRRRFTPLVLLFSEGPLVHRLRQLVHASPTPEPFGQVVVEAMALGTPVVATDAGGIPEIVIDDECGFLVPPGDAPALAEKICALLENPEKARAMAIRGRERVAAHFTAERMARRFEQVYKRLMVES
jgi:glycosyltransferase involved in cell wall biosynthesis